MPFAHRQRSHLSDFLFSACFLVNNQLCISSFATEKNTKKNQVEDFSGAFLLWLSVYILPWGISGQQRYVISYIQGKFGTVIGH